MLSPEFGWRLPAASGGLRYEAMTASALAKSGQVVVLAPARRHDGIASDHVRTMRIPFGRHPLPASVLVVPRLALAALAVRPRVIRVSSVAYFGLAAVVAAWLLRRLRHQVILTGQVLHVEPDGSIDSARGPLGRWLDLAVLRRCQRIVTPSAATAAAVRRLPVTGEAEVAVIVPGMAPPPSYQRENPANHPLRLLFVGRLKTRKNPLAFVEACLQVAGKRPVEVVVVGKGPLSGRMRQACGGLDITFIDSVSDLGWLYRWADVVVCTSTVEGFYFVGLEAMSWGAALVSFDIPALRELTGDGAAGKLAQPFDVAELAAAIDMSAEELRGLAEAGRKRATAYTIARFEAAVQETLLTSRQVAPCSPP